MLSRPKDGRIILVDNETTLRTNVIHTSTTHSDSRPCLTTRRGFGSVGRIATAVVLALIIIYTPQASAQKIFKPIRVALKAKKPADALKEVQKLEATCPTALRPKLLDYGMQACIRLNEGLNEKIYLKQAYDTVQFFRTIYDIFDYALRCDTAERALLAETGKPMHYQKPHAQTLRKYYRNLVAGGRFYFTRARYGEAIPFLCYALDVPRSALWSHEGRKLRRTTYVYNAVMLVRSAFMTHNYALARQYADIALEDTTAARRSMLAYLARSAQMMDDTEAYLDYLKTGLREYPAEPFFFTELVDFHADRNEYDATLALAEKMLQSDSANYYFLMAKGLSLMNMKKDLESVEYFKKAVVADSTHNDTYYYLGTALCNVARSVEVPANINSAAYKSALARQREYYKEARSPLETYRALQPSDAKRWAPQLYDVYFALNLGEQFAEMDEIVKTLR